MSAGGPRVLVVEDDDDIRELTCLLLGAAGFDAHGEPDGHAALEHLAGTEALPALVLVDLMMPRLDGEAFIRALRRDPRLRDVPTVVMSGNRAAHEAAARVGADGYLEKPVELETLLATLRRVFPSQERADRDQAAH